MCWALVGIVIDYLTVSRVTAGLGVSRSAANAAPAEWTPSDEDLAELDRIFPHPAA